MGSDPQWEDDKDFNPLQAADLMAWVTRRVHADTTEGKPLRVLDLLPGRMPVPTDIIDQNVDNLRDVARSMLADAPESPFEDDKGRGQRLKRFLLGA